MKEKLINSPLTVTALLIGVSERMKEEDNIRCKAVIIPANNLSSMFLTNEVIIKTQIEGIYFTRN